MSLTYANNARMQQFNTLKGDHEGLLEKYAKLAKNTQGLVDKVTTAVLSEERAKNELTEAESKLRIEKSKVARGEIRVREVLNNEFKNKTAGLEKENAILQDTVTKDSKIIEQLISQRDSSLENLQEMIKKVESTKTEITTIRNKFTKVVGKVNQAKNRIVSLNSSTPYRPGAVERTLADVLGDLRNV